ncbi:MAG TPA: lytic transglycosylase domain-containing protein [Coriobacteriia bacterium]
MVREHPLSWHRLLPLLAVAVLAVVAVAAAYGPVWYQRLYHPLGHEALIVRYAKANRIDPYLVAAVINTESGFREGVVSSAGAVGLMQVKPSTAVAVARAAGIRDEMTTEALSTAALNIRIGTAYLAELIARYDGDVPLALAAYNAGLGNADRWAKEARLAKRPFSESIAFPETARYVDEVVAQEKAYRSLYPDAFASALK